MSFFGSNRLPSSTTHCAKLLPYYAHFESKYFSLFRPNNAEDSRNELLNTNSLQNPYLCLRDESLHRGAFGRRGKSGQRRAPCFLTGRMGRKAQTASATENYRLRCLWAAGKGEKVR